MANVREDIGFIFSTNWGVFTIGGRVVLSDEAKQNDCYENFYNEVLIITSVDLDDTGCGVIEPIMSFSLLDGGEFPFSLYGYELELI